MKRMRRHANDTIVQLKMKASAETLVSGMSMFLPKKGAHHRDDRKHHAGELGRTGLLVHLGKGLRQLTLATHGEHDAARGAVESCSWGPWGPSVAIQSMMT